jgi:hypothetical protein
MASFKDKFLRDLEDLSDEDEEEKQLIEEDDDRSSQEEADDFAEYQEREEKVEKLISKGYQSKIRSEGEENLKFRQHIETIERAAKGELISK